MTSRIPVSEKTRDAIKDFAEGLGTTYDEALKFMLKKLSEENEKPKHAGHRLREEFDPSLVEDGE